MNDEERIEAARKAVLYEMERIGGGWNAKNIARAALTAAIPPGSVVVSADDLRRLVGLGIAFKGLLNTLGEQDDEYYPIDDDDQAALDRLRAKIGDES